MSMPTKSGVRGGCKRIERTACLYQLIAGVSASPEKIKHRVDNSVEHTYAETADERSEKIDYEIEGYDLAAYSEYSCLGSYDS